MLVPFGALVKTVVRLLAKPETEEAFYRGLRLMAMDGFVLDLPDTPENEKVFGRPGSGCAPGRFRRYGFWRCAKREPMCCGGA